MRVKQLKIAFFLSALTVFASGCLVAAGRYDTAQAAAAEPPSRAEQVARAFVKAYPGRVEKAEFRGDDWAVLLRGTWFHFAEGRMLPEEFLYRAENYAPLAFYASYTTEMPQWVAATEEQIAAFRMRGQAQQGGQVRRARAPYFFDTLYQTTSRAEAHAQMVPVDFLGFEIQIHRDIERELAMVEQAILAAARGGDAAVQSWIDGTGSVYGWNWRTIAGSQTRSFHSYGVAIDILPRAEVLAGREMYWAWAATRRDDWWDITLEERYHPPPAVVAAFESHGFVWGGKWGRFFDTMHFEFRPEVMILNGLPLIQAGS